MNPRIIESPCPENADFQNTLFVPITGNPAGYHHLVLAELALRQRPELSKVVYLLSNGHHPDPFKRSVTLPKDIRLQLMQDLLASLHQSAGNRLNFIVDQVEEILRLRQVGLFISISEFKKEGQVRLLDNIKNIWTAIESNSESKSKRIQVLVGSDLINRMQDPKIFSEADLKEMSNLTEWLVVSRPGERIADRFGEGLSLKQKILDQVLLPKGLKSFLNLSSTIIRRAVSCRQQLPAYLPDKAIKHLDEHLGSRLSNKIAEASEWEVRIQELERDLLEISRKVSRQLFERKNSPKIYFLETSTGGRIAGSLIGLPGSSKFVLGSQVAYANSIKEQLIGRFLGHRESSLSEELTKEMALAAIINTEADLVLAENGMAGPPDGTLRSNKNGACHLVLIKRSEMTEQPYEQIHEVVKENPFFTKQEHQIRFAISALELLSRQLDRYPTSVSH
ncbi:MAG: CinA family protein [SAR324 cluster bacterium]|nr:CinA family protein [SAR324 cluster bacterium]